MSQELIKGAPRLVFNLHPKQTLAFGAPATEVLYGGAAGGGKSYLMRVSAILWACWVPGLQVYLFRRLWPDLYLNHMEGPQSFPNLLAPIVESGHCQIVQKQLRFSNGSRIHLNHLQDDRALLRFQGAEIHALLIDELTHFTDTQYRYLRGRCRLGGLKIPDRFRGRFPRVLAGSNPGGRGHHWVKKGFVDLGDFAVKKMDKKEGGMVRTYVPAVLDDNPSMTENDPDYIDKLEGLGDPMLVRAMKAGDWTIVAGAAFGDVWRIERHTCQPFPIPVDWQCWRGGDDGFAAPAAVYWLTQDPVRKTYYVIGEFYQAGCLPDRLAEITLMKDSAISRIFPDGQVQRQTKHLSGNLDAAAFADTGQKEIPRGNQMNALGCNWTPVEKWPGSRVARAQLMHQLLAPNKLDPEGRPGIIFFTWCEHAIRTIPTLGRAKLDPEDVDTDGEDHAYDGVTYGLQFVRHDIKRKRLGGT